MSNGSCTVRIHWWERETQLVLSVVLVLACEKNREERGEEKQKRQIRRGESEERGEEKKEESRKKEETVM